MYKNRNFDNVAFRHRVFSDGVRITLPIDTFPVSDSSLFNESGWPMSTIGVIDRFSKDHVDEDIIKKIAQRCEELSVPESSDLTDEQKLMLLRPAWCQTPSEYALYQERVYQYRQELSKAAVADVKDINSSNEVSVSDSSENPSVTNG